MANDDPSLLLHHLLLKLFAGGADLVGDVDAGGGDRERHGGHCEADLYVYVWFIEVCETV